MSEKINVILEKGAERKGDAKMFFSDLKRRNSPGAGPGGGDAAICSDPESDHESRFAKNWPRV